MKKLSCIILSLILALSMVGCGDTAATQEDTGVDNNNLETEVSISDENIENSEVITETVHCDFDTAVEEYKKENSIEEFSADDEFDFYMTLYSQGVDPHGLECDNPLFAGYIKFHESKGELNTTEPTKPTPSNPGQGITISADGNTITSPRGVTHKKSDIGVFVPYEEVEQYVSEHCGEETARKLKAINEGKPHTGGFSDYSEDIQQQYFTTSSSNLSINGVKTIDEYVKLYIDIQYDDMTRTGSQSSDEAW